MISFGRRLVFSGECKKTFRLKNWLFFGKWNFFGKYFLDGKIFLIRIFFVSECQVAALSTTLKHYSLAH